MSYAAPGTSLISACEQVHAGREVSSEDGLVWKRGKEGKRMTVLLQALRRMYQAPILNMGTREGEWLHGREQTEALCFHSHMFRSDKRRQ